MDRAPQVGDTVVIGPESFRIHNVESEMTIRTIDGLHTGVVLMGHSARFFGPPGVPDSWVIGAMDSITWDAVTGVWRGHLRVTV